MNNFNTVFAIVQKHCNEREILAGTGDFQAIAAEAGVTTERLHFYLDCIQEIGLIKYSHNDKKITLTKKGRETDHVFP